MNHETFMHRCLELAKLGTGQVAPNPLVGCVIVHDNRIIGEGYHQKCGEAHAEVNAINSVEDKSKLTEATVYVSLEPCAHHGKTPPCANLLVDSGVKQVVIATLDPHEKVAGKGVKILEDAGIDVTVGVLEKEAQTVTRRFFTFHQKNRPYVVLKWAESADGFLDHRRRIGNMHPLKISSENSDVYSHGLRASEHAILVGTNTALFDDPSLTTRNCAGTDPIRIVLDRTLRLPSSLKLFSDGNPTIILNERKSELVGQLNYIKLDQWNLNAILSTLHDLQIRSVMIEGGEQLLNDFISQGLWNEAHCIRSSKVTAGSGPIAPTIKGLVCDSLKSGDDVITVYQNPALDE